jgi:hypothetical protein
MLSFFGFVTLEFRYCFGFRYSDFYSLLIFFYTTTGYLFFSFLSFFLTSTWEALAVLSTVW